jgi:PmbA protein
LAAIVLNEPKKIGKRGQQALKVIVAHSISEENVAKEIEKLKRLQHAKIFSIQGLTAYIGQKEIFSISTSNSTKSNIKQAIVRCYEMAKNTPEDIYCGLPENNDLEKNYIDLDLFDNSIISYEVKKDFISECETASTIT